MVQGLLRATTLLSVVAVAACPASTPTKQPIASEEGRLAYTFEQPTAETEGHARFDSPDRTFSEERYDWQSNSDPLNRAGLVLRELKPGATGFGFKVPDDPEGSVNRWSTFADKTLFFDEPFGTSNNYGSATWRRFTRGGSVCVVFLQTWPTVQDGPITRTLEGYYCAEAGDRLSVGQAEQVVQSVQITLPAPPQDTGS